MQRKARTRKAPATPAKRPRGRPRRDPELVRLTVYIPRATKLWLAHQAIDADCDMGVLVAGALQAKRAQLERQR